MERKACCLGVDFIEVLSTLLVTSLTDLSFFMGGVKGPERDLLENLCDRRFSGVKQSQQEKSECPKI